MFFFYFNLFKSGLKEDQTASLCISQSVIENAKNVCFYFLNESLDGKSDQ